MSDDVRVLFLDIEATNLKADFGYMLCVSWKWEGEKKVHHRSIADAPTFKDDPTNDAWIVEELRPILEEADVVVFHYGSRFDYPYLQTRALYHGHTILPKVKWVDTWRVARDNLALSSNRLASLTRLLQVEEKTPVDGRIWMKAMAGHKPSIKYVVEHCDQDIVVLEQVYQKIRGLRYDNPNLSAKKNGACPTCGSYNVHKRGQEKTVKQLKDKFSCGACGHWFSRPAKKEGK